MANTPDSEENLYVDCSAAQGRREMDEGNLAMTFSALATLAALEDDLEGVDIEAIVRALGSLQQEDGRWALAYKLDSARVPYFAALLFHE